MSLNQRWYRQGTVSIASNTTALTGTLTGWLNQVQPGDFFIVGTTMAEVASVNSNTSITLATDFPSTLSGAAYAIARVSPLWSLSATLDLDVRRLLDSISDLLQGAGAPASTLGGEGALYYDRTAKAWYGPKTNGAWGSPIPATGANGTNGVGVPTGGTVGQVLTKASGTDYDAAWQTPAGGGGAAIRGNLLINGDFQINQRVFAGGSLAAGVYGFDRWKATTGGASASLSSYTLTLASGELEQVIEPALWGLASFASQSVTVSVEAPSQDLTVSVGAITGTITAGAGQRSVTITVASGETGNLSFKIKRAAAGSVTFARVKVELGSSATAWQARDRETELRLCRRYFFKSYPLGTAVAAAVYAGAAKAVALTANQTGSIAFGLEMRATPTVATYSPQTGATGVLTDPTTSTNTGAATFTGASSVGIAYAYLAGGGLVVGREYIVHLTASAEL